MSEFTLSIPESGGTMLLMDERQTYGQLIAQYRAARGLQGKDLAPMIGIAPSTLSNIENGVRKGIPTPDEVQLFHEALGVPKRLMLERIGYLDPEELESGVAHVVSVDDPRARLLDVLGGASDPDVRAIFKITSTIMETFRSQRGRQE